MLRWPCLRSLSVCLYGCRFSRCRHCRRALRAPYRTWARIAVRPRAEARVVRPAERAAPVAVAHEHGLHRVAVVGAEERLHRPVPRLALGHDLERRERHLALEVRPQRLRERRHRLVGGDTVGRPSPRLAGAVLGLTPLGEDTLEETAIHARTDSALIRPPCAGRSRARTAHDDARTGKCPARSREASGRPRPGSKAGSG